MTRLSAVLALILAAGHSRADRPTPPFFPLGVCWRNWKPAADFPDKEAGLERFLDDLQARRVNLVWTINGPTDGGELRLFRRLAAARGVRLVPGGYPWMYGLNDDKANDAALPVVAETARKVWDGFGPDKPFALNVGEEPNGGVVPYFGRLAGELRKAGIRTAGTVMWMEVDRAAAAARGLDYLSLDYYPFFGSPNGPRGPASYQHFAGHVRALVAATARHGQTPWVMGQAFQEVWGPYRVDARGRVTVLKGGGTHWKMPTADQMHWQVWAAAALGAKGFLFFSYGYADAGNERAAPLRGDWIEKADRDTGTTMSLIHGKTWEPGPPADAMAAAYGEVGPLAGFLAGLDGASDSDRLAVVPREAAAAGGNVVNLLREPRTGHLYLAAVAAPELRGPLEVWLAPNAGTLVPVHGAPAAAEAGPAVAPYRKVTLPLRPGRGAFYRVEPRRAAERVVLASEDYSAEAWKGRAASVVQLRRNDAPGQPRGLVPTVNEPTLGADPGFPMSHCHVTYDLTKLGVGPAPEGASRLFEFDAEDAWGNGIGVFVFSGPSAGDLKPLAGPTKEHTLIALPDGHTTLRMYVSVREVPLAGAAFYTCLRGWRVVEWRPMGW